MTDIAMKAKVGLAALAVAASASLVPITVAEAAPVQAPATPVLFGPGNVPQWGFTWGHGMTTDLLKTSPVHKFGFFFFNLFNCHKPYHVW